MRRLVATVRILAVFLGGFLAMSSVLDIFGLVPYSAATPQFLTRLLHSAPVAIGSSCLVLPYRAIRSVRARLSVAIILGLVAARTLYISINGIFGFLVGEKSWHVVPTAMAVSAVIFSNLWAFRRISWIRSTLPSGG